MSKTSVITTRIDPELKADIEEIFSTLGLTTSQAITLFLNQVALRQGLPFDVAIPTPNQETIDALEEGKFPENLPKFESTQELFDDLGI